MFVKYESEDNLISHPFLNIFVSRIKAKPVRTVKRTGKKATFTDPEVIKSTKSIKR